MKRQRKAARNLTGNGRSLLENLRAEIAEGAELLRPTLSGGGRSRAARTIPEMLGSATRLAAGRPPTNLQRGHDDEPGPEAEAKAVGANAGGALFWKHARPGYARSASCMTTLELRIALKAGGFAPIPCVGKSPLLD